MVLGPWTDSRVVDLFAEDTDTQGKHLSSTDEVSPRGRQSPALRLAGVSV